MSRGLPKKVKISLNKAIDSALLAVDVYNKPATKFKSGGFVVLMIIAWTSLFHAIFFNRKIKPFRKRPHKRNYEKRDGDYVYWELAECLNEYYKNEQANPIKVNLELFIPIRNMIEHKSLPEIDSDLFSECQSMLINFDDVLEKEFGEKYCIRESLSFSLQLFPSNKNIDQSLSRNKESLRVKDFISKYRSSLSHDILDSGQYSFKAFLIQVSNHNSKDALPVQFIQYDKLSEAEKRNVKRVVALVKHKTVPVHNQGLFKPKQVVLKVKEALGNEKIHRNGKLCDKIHMGIHTNCWKYYKVRPINGDPTKTRAEYCIYDELNNSYGYTQAWIDFLIKKLADAGEYNKISKFRNNQ